ncbi:aminotransferase class I/II-fold pyridoxal phosphate-dependent enzyme [Clostridium tarantellae]|uniref:Aminotransferase class I/II-fold pyridoxal phosphate-dependent enzyme n=1 Tax=Clostridium tarantellae TaxID=39493 RepID=A0A6I1MPZ4_9CLOT|nr:aminotransferase class I/II-fold pyridoxal phosphate-dependent enzyme [Clostridium tarantellae]MPQ45134.1 aminotransferase class I/II-fold pyridoxal phosphate-dependent enzyme [Clostridium tarantellae]
MKKVPLFDAIKKYTDNDVIQFSMPGHKMGRAFNKFKDILIKGDLTEVDGLDNLHKPEGVIKESEYMLSKLYDSYKSYFLINGSTSGNLIMIFSAFKEGDKVLVERNCHRSIMNGIIMRKLNPIFVKNIIDEKLKAPIGLDLEHLKCLLEEYNDLKGIILTYPNYYGLGINIKKSISLCKKYELKILIDSAHGAHLGFFNESAPSAQQLGADMVVMSAHKTLPSLTQTAWIHINNKNFIENVQFYKGIFMSTSPSYMFMMSLEYARAFLQYDAKEAYQYLIKQIKNLKEKINLLDYIEVVDLSFFNNNIKDEIFIDNTRIILNLKENLNGNKLLDYLREKNIQCEMSDNKNVVLIPTPFNLAQEFDKLYKILAECPLEKIKEKELKFHECDIPKKGKFPYEVIDNKKKLIDLDNSIGKIVGENIIPYPPGIPLLIMGEIIEFKHINLIKDYIRSGTTIIGLYDDKIKVLI